jgi:hypothetical protein
MLKKLFTIGLMFAGLQAFSQTQYLTFEFMKVQDKDLVNYMALEDFWSKIHQEQIKEGACTGWDLWSLRPGGQDQGFQYLAVTVYKDMKQMMAETSVDQLMDAAKKAYPNMSQDDIMKKTLAGSASRERAVILYLADIDQTKGNFDMPLGTVAQMDFMKAEDADAYVKAEKEVFKPLHQKVVDQGLKGSWSLASVILPSGTEAYATHITFNMYKDMNQYIAGRSLDLSKYVTDWDAVNKGVATRKDKWEYLATLINKLR